MDNLLLSQMLLHADPSQVAGLSRFFKTGPGQYGEGDKFLGIKVPVTREVVKECWKSINLEELEECIVSEYHEVRLAALLALVEIFRHSGKKQGAKRMPVSMTERNDMTKEDCVRFYLSHTDKINNWDLVDLSCYNILGEWLLDKDRTLLYDLARNGKTIWEQRIGIVSTMMFIRHGQLDDSFAIADILLHHPHDLIQKAVGWLLREAGKKDKSRLEAYLKGVEDSVRGNDNCVMDKHTSQHTDERRSRYLTMPRTMLRYAIEKFPETERQSYLSGRVL